MNCNEVYPALVKHVANFFAGHTIDYFTWQPGHSSPLLPRFRVARVAPGPRIDLWIYVSIGTWEVDHDAHSGLEFIILAPHESPRMVEFLAMSAHYHRSHTLGHGHTYPIGQPWLPNSALSHILVSLPYPFGPDLEVCDVPDGHVHFLWLLPITAAEHEFKAQHGLEALEQRFDSVALDFSNPDRSSAV